MARTGADYYTSVLLGNPGAHAPGCVYGTLPPIYVYTRMRKGRGFMNWQHASKVSGKALSTNLAQVVSLPPSDVTISCLVSPIIHLLVDLPAS